MTMKTKLIRVDEDIPSQITKIGIYGDPGLHNGQRVEIKRNQ